jgi:cellulose synthase/poly-beta-1,6-N-acetylglucosamine synthase-like glycosyltransferase
MLNPPFISVIVPVFNGEKTIDECIKSLLNLEYPKERYETIIVDNNSTDNTRQIVKKYPVTLLLETKRGSYAARNAGIRAAKGDILAFTDSDCIVDKNWLEHIIKKFDNAEVGGVGGKVIAYNPITIVEQYTAKFSGDLDQETFMSYKEPFIITANAAYRRDVLYKIGRFDESFLSGGDMDLGWRVFWQGFKIVYEPKAIVYHKHRTTLKGLFFQSFKYAEGHVRLFKKYGNKNKKKYQIHPIGYFTMGPLFILRLLWRLITAYQQKKDERSLYVATPICTFIQDLGYKVGKIHASIKHRIIYL